MGLNSRSPVPRRTKISFRKYFDSGDFALSKTKTPSDAGAVITGSEHPTRETVTHPSSPVPSSSNVGDNAGEQLVQCGSLWLRSRLNNYVPVVTSRYGPVWARGRYYVGNAQAKQHKGHQGNAVWATTLSKRPRPRRALRSGVPGHGHKSVEK
ncbi:hypothetical protein GGTG_12146 [Gaeumannomyces tritici R3-111a-1]|uniref:mRNA stability protein n=1 Tax=Gaeumannomyces tritici (strain R3-111a-1) TaxID=644352 RepID=J3PF67_GAET3|nr:hypothetical protein GGTG_12146 [Gaeumannomyces tritici R3-111a-1]EJT69969.1 hypothetical protein GGTG_12146 [Gaeumannomyces tritici R3-111a-1]